MWGKAAMTVRKGSAGAKDRGTVEELRGVLAKIDHHYPRAGVMYGRLIVALMMAPDRTMTVADLSDQMGKGRDSSAVQNAVARLVDLGILTRQRVQGDEGGVYYLVTMVRERR